MSYFNLIYAEELPHRAVAVFMYLKERSDKDGRCWPSIGLMQAELKLGRSTVKRAIDDLIKSGHLVREFRYRDNGSQSSSYYYIKQ